MHFMCAKILQFFVLILVAHTHYTYTHATYYSDVVEAVANDICDVVRVYFCSCSGLSWILGFIFFSQKLHTFVFCMGFRNLRDVATKNNNSKYITTSNSQNNIHKCKCVNSFFPSFFSCFHSRFITTPQIEYEEEKKKTVWAILISIYLYINCFVKCFAEMFLFISQFLSWRSKAIHSIPFHFISFFFSTFYFQFE